MAAVDPLEQRVLVLAPTGRDAALACEVLTRAGLVAEGCRDMASVCDATAGGVGAVLVAEEALSPVALTSLSEVLARQPPWSDLPIVIFAAAVDTRLATARMEQMLELLGNVTIVERPLRVATLVTVIKAALRARNRQYAARQLLTALGEQQEEARRRADFEQQLIGIVSHDLRNPLSAILLSTSMLLKSEGLDEQAARFLPRIHTAADRALRMIRDLLDFTQARLGGGIRIERREADLHEVVRAVLEEVEATHAGRELRTSRAGDGRGQWDPDRLGQVVQNLVTNALKYSPERTPVRVETRGDEEGVTLIVHNEGAPIPPDRLERLFQPMQRATGDADPSGRSIGLGLYIVKHLVDAHGGQVAVTSDAGAGTTFTVWLPRAPEGTRRAADGGG